MSLTTLILAAMLTPVQENQNSQHSILKRESRQQYSILVRTDVPETQPLPVERVVDADTSGPAQLPLEPVAERLPAEPGALNPVQKPLERVAQNAEVGAAEKPGHVWRISDRIKSQQDEQRTVRFELAGPGQVRIGELQTYRIHVANPKDVEGNLELQLRLPPGIQFADSTVQGVLNPRSNHVTWQFADVEARESIEIFYRARAVAPGTQRQALFVAPEQQATRHQELQTLVR